MQKTQFTQVLRAANLDPVMLQTVTRKLDEVLSAKNEQLSDLQYETQRLTKAHGVYCARSVPNLLISLDWQMTWSAR